MTEDQATTTPLAGMLVYAYLETAAYSRGFSDEHDQPPTMLAKAHHLRAVVQAAVNQDERYRLGADYAEFGRVEIEDCASGRRYLLRSDGTVAIERAKNQTSLFDSTQYVRSDVVLLVYKFHQEGLDLAYAGTRHEVGRTRVEATGMPTYIGTWPYVADDAEPFDQREEDPFGDVGEVDDFGEEEGLS